MTPQNIMAYLRHDSGHKSLATVPQVSRLIDRPDAPSMIEYVDTAKLFDCSILRADVRIVGGAFRGERQRCRPT